MDESSFSKLNKTSIIRHFDPSGDISTFKREIRIDQNLLELFFSNSDSLYATSNVRVELEDDDKIKVSFKSKCGKVIDYSFNLDEIDDFEIFDKFRAKFEPEYKDFEDN